MDLAPLEIYTGKMLFFKSKIPYLYSIQMSPKYVWGIGLIASSLDYRHVGVIQTRVQEGVHKGVNEIYIIKTHVLGHLNEFHFENLTPAATFIK